MTTTKTTAPSLTTVGATQYVLGTPDVVAPGAVLTIGPWTYTIVALRRRGVIGGVEQVAASYTRTRTNPTTLDASTWGDDPQDNEGYWAGRY